MRKLHLGPEALPVCAKQAVGRADHGHQIAATIDAAEQRARESVPVLPLWMTSNPTSTAAPAIPSPGSTRPAEPG